MGKQEANLCVTIIHRGRVYCCCKLLCPGAVVEKPTSRSWLRIPEVPILCDNTSTISLAKNLVQHTRTKHIDVRHHFIRDHVQKKDVKVQFVPTQHQLADIFTKPLGADQFAYIRGNLGMVNPNEV